MAVPGFPSLFYSREPLPTKTILLRDEVEFDSKTPKINWSTSVVDLRPGHTCHTAFRSDYGHTAGRLYDMGINNGLECSRSHLSDTRPVLLPLKQYRSGVGSEGCMTGVSRPLEKKNNLSETKNILSPYYDNDEGLMDCMEVEDNYEIFPTKSGKFKTTFHVPSALLPVVVGPKGSKLRQLQEMTQTLIKVPRAHEVGVPVKITGHSERSVASARNQITLLVLTKREKFASTHFISIPVDSNDVRDNFMKFKNEILKDKATRGIDENIFQNPYKLHMTIDVLSLLDQIEIDHAKQLFSENVKEMLSTYLPKDHYKFRLKGVEIMNDDPSEVDVLYAEVRMDNKEDNDDLQELVDRISNLFYINGYVRKQYEHVKLHVTLMNSLFRKDGNEKRTTFDASFILDKYRDYDFGTAAFKSIDLSVRFTTAANGYYNSEISVHLQGL